MKTIILLLAIAALAAAAPKPSKLHYRNLFKKPVGEIKTEPNPRIIGGQEAVPHSIPYQALLEVHARGEAWYCGGSLVSENYVLTAAHCNVDGITAVVTLGAHKSQEFEDTQVVVTSTALTYHEDYDADNIFNDVGVIKLPEVVTFTEAIQSATLPSRADVGNTYEGQLATISGWGLTDGAGDQISDVLNTVNVTVIDNDLCGSYVGDLPPSNICTSGDEKTGICSGDSGGPLVVDGVQIGVASFTVVNCYKGWPSGYARVTSFLDWIEANTDVQIQ